jgi:gamma-glutamylcyclotransferase (GGCT)/AIG2-like uncharacterized protein YtfP
MPSLFSYGTLQREDVQLETFGRRLTGEPDELLGFELGRVAIGEPAVAAKLGRSYYDDAVPARSEIRLPGTVLEVTEDELATADHFELGAAYRRIAATTASGRSVWLYRHAAPSAVLHTSLDSALASGPPPPANLAVPVFSHGTLDVELYRPEGVDAQTPHTRDEIYVVARGKADLFDGLSHRAVRPGSVIFVPAGHEHRFERFTSDFAVWVFFYGPEGGETNARR